ncbi:MAG: CDP-alcohol phosphatidyltransferase family protein [Anaerolineae bacterium]|nr:CDP-alcohol phosphatidyltransferase family protein [Anaerolineae bacterium]MDK1080980.1 CDP-alcohol phosphatidyltransferase family protein [Anaerolineae bacterium]MDK1117355.1 CDP-alcohol phosphatidyltransferase family protein [Anaerolineae bacterium]
MENNSIRTPVTLTDRMRVWFKWIIDPIGRFFLNIGMTPNMMTALGMIGNFLGAYYLSQGKFMQGGWLILILTPIDALDGTMARLRGEPSDFGAFVDSISDRYAEIAILGGIMYYYANQGNALGSTLAFAAASGSVLVSYVKARAESLEYEAKIGVLTRVERYLVLAPLLVFNLPMIALWILAIFGNFTALQRIWFVRRQAHANMK